MQPNYQNNFKVTEVLQNLLITTNDYTAELLKTVSITEVLHSMLITTNEYIAILLKTV